MKYTGPLGSVDVTGIGRFERDKPVKVTADQKKMLLKTGVFSEVKGKKTKKGE